VVTIDGKPVTGWIARRLLWARRHGWSGRVLSGYRTPSEQLRAAQRYAERLQKPIWQVYPNGPLASNHVRKGYGQGAVDVSEPAELEAVLARGPKWVRDPGLIGNGRRIPGDYAHFSANGH